jgi:hypothetical protein
MASLRRCHGFHDATDDNAIGKDVVVVIVPLTGWARSRRTLED